VRTFICCFVFCLACSLNALPDVQKMMHPHPYHSRSPSRDPGRVTPFSSFVFFLIQFLFFSFFIEPGIFSSPLGEIGASAHHKMKASSAFRLLWAPSWMTVKPTSRHTQSVCLTYFPRGSSPRHGYFSTGAGGLLTRNLGSGRAMSGKYVCNVLTRSWSFCSTAQITMIPRTLALSSWQRFRLRCDGILSFTIAFSSTSRRLLVCFGASAGLPCA